MIRIPAILCALSMISAAADLPDLLRFTNQDQLRGTFRGMREGPQVLWQNEDLAEPAAFKTDRIRHIVLRGGRPVAQLGTLSHAGLVNGDEVPGTITALDDEAVTLETGYAGKLRIPRDHLTMLAPNPLGGRVLYYGPFAEDDWKMIHEEFPDGLPAAEKDTADTAEDGDEDGEDEEGKPGRWDFSGSAWYWKHKGGGTALIRETGMPAQSVLRFEMAWKNRLNLSIALHADFVRPQPLEKNEVKRQNHAGVLMNPSSMPRLFGSCYVLQLYSNYLTLMRISVNADGKTTVDRPRLSGGSTRMGETGRARIELRSNHRTGEIILFVNDEFTAQWSGMEVEADAELDGDEPDAPSTREDSGFGFVSQGGDSPVRISDIIISEWNGMPDSARSLQMDDQDVVLMVNGTDRYAGKVGGLDDQGALLFEGRHGRFRFPLEDVSEIRFARQRLAAAGEAPADNVIVRLAPIGAVSGQPLAGGSSTLGIISPVMGRMDISLKPAVMIDFNASSTLIDDWNADF